MSTPVMIAVIDRDIEQRILAAYARRGARLAIVRRCVDLPDLIAASVGCAASAAIVSAGLRGLDRDAVARLHEAGLVVVAVGTGADRDPVLPELGVDAVVSGTAIEAVADSVMRAIVASTTVDRGPQAPVPALVPAPSKVPRDPAHPLTPEPGQGRIIAVWGPAGAPGRTLLATTLAAEGAAAGSSTLLIDAEVYAASIAQSVGIVDEIPGIAAACRLANLGELDLPRLAGLAKSLSLRQQRLRAPLRVLTGLPRADRWPELRPAALEQVLSLARSLADVTVVDCSSCLEQDEELSYDVAAPRRNGATLAVLRAADEIVVVGRADPVGLTRLVRGLEELETAVDGRAVTVVVNRVRKGPIVGNPMQESAQVLRQFGGVTVAGWLPEDSHGVDTAVAAGLLLLEAAPASPYRIAVRALAADLFGPSTPAPVRRFARRRLARVATVSDTIPMPR